MQGKRKLFLLVLGLLLLPSTLQGAEFTLNTIHKDIQADFPGVSHLPADTLLKAIQKNEPEDFIIFDVREKREFEISHIKGAYHLSPSSWAYQFINKYGQKVKGKKVVFYCSVGVRSSKMARYLKQDLLKAGATSVNNLTQGLFGWSNNQYPMVNAKGPTSMIHPYDEYWGQLLQSKENWRY